MTWQIDQVISVAAVLFFAIALGAAAVHGFRSSRDRTKQDSDSI